MKSWFVKEGIEEGILFPQYLPIRGEFSVPPFLSIEHFDKIQRMPENCGIGKRLINSSYDF